MILNVPRGGKRIETQIRNYTFRRTNENDPIGADRVIGVDTETLPDRDGILKTVLIPYSSTHGVVSQSQPIEEDNPITVMLDFTMLQFAETYARKSRVKNRFGKGSRESVKPVLWVFYNLEYDIQRLFSPDSPFFRFIRHGREDVVIQVGKYELQLVHVNATGNAPSFQILCFDTQTQKVARIYGMDMWGYWKTGLDKTAKSLKVGEKVNDIPPEWFDIPLEDWTEEMWQSFIQYAGVDADLTRNIYLATAELLGNFSTAVFNRVGMLPPSAPAAAARLAFSMASEEEWQRAPKHYEQMALDGYHGGYVAANRRGKVEGLTMNDLKSAYPSAMILLPDPCTAEYAMIPPGIWADIPHGIRISGNLGFVVASFKVKRSLFPSISENRKKYTAHQPGDYTRFTISLPELSVLFDLNQIDSATIHEGFIMIGSPEHSFLRKFVLKFYELKEKEEKEGRKNSAVYLAAKLLMNSLYGKLIEIHVPPIPAIEDASYLYEDICLEPGDMPRINKIRNAAEVYTNNGLDGILNFSEQNLTRCFRLEEKPEILPLDELLMPMQATGGAYFMPIYASLITAMTRAKICTLLNCFEAYLGDTDSFGHRLIYGSDEYAAAEKRANGISIRAGTGGVRESSGLLGYGVELRNASGYIAGIKQYVLIGLNEKGKEERKLAHHAITDPPGKESKHRMDFCAAAVESLALGKTVTYTTRKKPRRLRESLLRNDGKYGYFISKQRTVTPKQDERMHVVALDENGALIYEWKQRDELPPDNAR